MDKNITKAMGFGEEIKQVEQGNCPLCHKPVHPNSFKNEPSLREYRISGMCQKCQDDFFGA